jgi:integrase
MSMNLEDVPSVKRWFREVSTSGTASDATKKTYLHFLQRFCDFMGMDPDEIIDERREHLREKDEHLQRIHEEKLKDWRTQLEKEEGLARGSVVTANNIIKSFYKANYGQMLLKAPKSWKTRKAKTPTPNELYLMVEKGCRNERNQAIIAGLSSTGISLEDFTELLTYNRIKEDLEAGIEPIHIRMIRTKIKREYDTFLNASAIEYFKRYLKTITIKPDQPLFPLTNRAIEYIVEKSSRRVHIKNPHITPHRLRSFFNTYMTMSLLGDSNATKHLPIVDYWMGHVIPYRGAYLVPPVDLPENSTTPSQRMLYKNHEEAISIRRI